MRRTPLTQLAADVKLQDKLECSVPLATANGSVLSGDLLEINRRETIEKILDSAGIALSDSHQSMGF